MSTASVLPQQNTVVAEIFIAAPPQRVFEAITDPKQMPLWWGQEGLYRITEWKGDIRVGGKGSRVGAGGGGDGCLVGWGVLGGEPPRGAVAYVWWARSGGLR